MLMDVADQKIQLPCAGPADALVYLRILQTYGDPMVPEGMTIERKRIEVAGREFCDGELHRRLEKDRPLFASPPARIPE